MAVSVPFRRLFRVTPFTHNSTLHSTRTDARRPTHLCCHSLSYSSHHPFCLSPSHTFTTLLFCYYSFYYIATSFYRHLQYSHYIYLRRLRLRPPTHKSRARITLISQSTFSSNPNRNQLVLGYVDHRLISPTISSPTSNPLDFVELDTMSSPPAGHPFLRPAISPIGSGGGGTSYYRPMTAPGSDTGHAAAADTTTGSMRSAVSGSRPESRASAGGGGGTGAGARSSSSHAPPTQSNRTSANQSGASGATQRGSDAEPPRKLSRWEEKVQGDLAGWRGGEG